ncbi:metal-binding protein [Paenibacillus glycanilyticus]|uniref:Metal-binding protein n=1 Tax=Paenibacillus glycanilyticus TaxID=126569 RepID=A0ABQ6NT44_9BACL|nr:metal-dependent hydrolase [Paenibacillus glycanilyticus]GMK48283.1 metal-binding protein [Paenibacillus glycanilyticus]
MKGTTHLTIGVAIGSAAAAHYPFTLVNAATYIAVAAFSALSADLDGPSLLSSKASKISKWLHGLLLGSGWLLTAVTAYLYFSDHYINIPLGIACAALLLLGLVVRSGTIRNALVSAVGAALIYGGITMSMTWLIGFGVFVVWVPWLKHRGLTHTVWAVVAWGAIAWGLEKQLRLEGIMQIAVAGYLSHLIADTLTPSGVKWLYPLVKKSFKLPFL